MSVIQEILEKHAFMRVGDLEDVMGVYLSDAREERARELLGKQKSKSFALRHPIITGIPTLGLWPLIAEDMALDRIKARMLRDDANLRSAAHKAYTQRYARETERLKATQPERTADRLGLYGLAITDRLADR